MTRFIAVASGKGGTGKTTTAINLGTALSDFGREVIVIDANVSKPNISLHLGTPKLRFTLHDALRGNKHITEVAYLHPSGLKVIPGNISVEEADKANIHRLKEVLIDLVGTSEIILLDLSSGVGSEVEETLRASDDLIVVTNPEIPAVADALKIIRIAERVGCNVLGIVVNRVTGDKMEMMLKNIVDILQKPILGVIPEDISVKKSLAVKHPVVYTHPRAPSSVAFKKLAAKLLGESYKETLEKEESQSMLNYVLKGLGLK